MKTKGEQRVIIDFNVTDNSTVTLVKQQSAKLIDICEDMIVEHTDSGEAVNASSEKRRLISLAQTAYEEAAMWAVKAIFTK